MCPGRTPPEGRNPITMLVSFPGCSPSLGRLRLAPFLTVLIACVFVAGCVQRRMMVRTSPPGALVYIDDYEIGTTPVATDFTYYGKRKIRLVKDGYETQTIMQPVRAPWYQIPPLDFVSENVIPWEIRDQRTLNYQLAPQMVVPTEQLLGRAEQFRRSSQAAGGVVPASTTPIPPGSPTEIHPTPLDPNLIPPPPDTEVIPAPPPIGGQPVHPLPPE